MNSNTIFRILVLTMCFCRESNAFHSFNVYDDSCGNRISVKVIDIGSRRELFVDNYLVEKLSGGANLRLHHPVPKEIAIRHNKAWEGNGTSFHSIFKDGDIFRMYYSSFQLDILSEKNSIRPHTLFCAYAESTDGINWVKPNLGIHEFEGSRENNIVMASGEFNGIKVDAGQVSVFKDTNPNVAQDEKYKAFLVAGIPYPHGIIPFKSSDGLNWAPMSKDAVIVKGAFDSQNTAFWDSERKEYRVYFRYFTGGTTTSTVWKPSGVRGIRTATSPDFLNWTEPVNLQYSDTVTQELYTNAIKPYHRAPHILLGFPARYLERKWDNSMHALPEKNEREERSQKALRYGTALSEALLISSRDGENFERWNDAFLRPGIERAGTWSYGNQYMGWHIIETRSELPGAPDELSLFAVEDMWTGDGTALRRYVIRKDGFVSLHSPYTAGTMTTKPLLFDGKALELNFSSGIAGGLKVEIQDENGRPVPGFSENDCFEIYGDSLERIVAWKEGSDVSSLKGKTVKLQFTLKDADLFSFRFVK